MLDTHLTQILTLSCAIFVLFQGYKCVKKYDSAPTTTHVSIKKAAYHPEVTICPKNAKKVYNENLEKCNLTYNDYTYKNKWIGNDNCKAPKKVWETMVGGMNNVIFIAMVVANDKSIRQNLNANNFRAFDSVYPGIRCYTLIWPKMKNMMTLFLSVIQDVTVTLHQPDEYFGSESPTIDIYSQSMTKVKTIYETFEVLDFDGEPCATAAQKRDECILNAAQKESEMQVGCTGPYLQNKSNICITQDQAIKAKAHYIMWDIVNWNQTKATKLCPKSCLQYIISVSNKELKSSTASFGILTLDFPKFIRVSQTSYSYGVLELIAEFGGYVGLFLGVSINQAFDLTKAICAKIKSTYRSFSIGQPEIN